MAQRQRAAAVPPVLLSRQALADAGVEFPPGATGPSTIPLTPGGSTYTMAQAAQFVDGDHFAIGRWDGSLGVFTYEASATQGPLISAAAANPESEGVQMITVIGQGLLVTSGTDSAMTLWKADGGWDQMSPVTQIAYDGAFGAANCGAVVSVGGGSRLVVGHANGYLTAWTLSGLEQCMEADLRHEPPLNPYGLVNIRSVQYVAGADDGEAVVATGGEDGYICLVKVPTGTILGAAPYNPRAQRGINSIAVDGTSLLVANCSVGSADSNLWLFEIDADTGSITYQDNTNLKVDPARPQVFNFATVFSDAASGTWLASTEEGVVWMGSVVSGQLHGWGYTTLASPPLGSAIAVSPGGQVVVANYDLFEFTDVPTSAPQPG
ncbi:MAG TPA: hypothetical protein VF228_12345 [Iamia sp.]